ncbi:MULTISPECIES: omptin family outer membrane protease [unclassified Legionella]|uniref:omptin family outer membrane protease n=1 Tax=unclassified Legionella TaxID=2622702 RepID=UPI001E4A9D86|nr:omptin family outer membrane protease [Legionella sp. 31fI33]MCC5015940.1 omptin family outer membrane protease [Legionella sp. 31fI33]
MQNNKVVMLALIALPLTFSLNANASTSSTDYSFNGLSLSASLGSLSGKSQEYVYDSESGRKMSQLDWRIKNAPIVNGEVNYDFLSWLSLNGRGWVTLGKSKTTMDDYDWLDPFQSNWTDWSHHENTHLNYGNELDLNLRAWIMQKQNYKLGLVAGYQRNSYSWRAVGGCYQYENGSEIGCFVNDDGGIGYQQKFNTPYVGLSGKYVINNFEFNALLKFSDWANAQDRDEHYSRGLTFKERGQNSKFYSATIDAGYHFTQSTKLFAAASYNHYSKGLADTEIIDNMTGERAYFNNAAGISNKSYILSLGIQYLFG